MITGFDKETAPLTADELKMVPVFVRCMEENHRGEHRAVSATKICEAFNRGSAVKWEGPRLRKLVNHCVCNDLVHCLVANSKGYYIATDYGECLAYMESLRGRIEAMAARVDAIKRQSNKEFAPKQLNLFQE